METTRITVYDHSGARFGASNRQIVKYLEQKPVEYHVNAYCVGGEDGIQAYWTQDGMLYIANGDDGLWWLTGIFCASWTPETIAALTSTLEAK